MLRNNIQLEYLSLNTGQSFTDLYVSDSVWDDFTKRPSNPDDFLAVQQLGHQKPLHYYLRYNQISAYQIKSSKGMIL